MNKVELKNREPGVGQCPCFKPEKGLTLCPIRVGHCGYDDNNFIDCAEYEIILEKNIEKGCSDCGKVKSRNDMNWYDLPMPDDVWQSLKKISLCPMCKRGDR